MLASDAAAGPWSFCNTGQEEKGLGPPGVESGGRRLKLNLPQRDLPTHPDCGHCMKTGAVTVHNRDKKPGRGIFGKAPDLKGF